MDARQHLVGHAAPGCVVATPAGPDEPLGPAADGPFDAIA
jgi:hypothetical protein